ncbi:hypothetical protein Tdes44962_MAKER05878 [Teratosphaeria destructans]|uniref:Uncharacterized protein n=1 Tax=Teratosphaeria destructans TaxID=418781 RepID=A0A9W7SIZ0_9PEZI|nr:hypothetical protein Tdes44962_MAKER05878 [Teratosphaeria destructans]
MKTSTAVMALLCSAVIVAGHKRRKYERCRCMTKNIGGIATGDKNDAATQQCCPEYSTNHPGLGSYTMVGPEWCTWHYGDYIDGDDWWDLCAATPGAAAGQCEPYGGK